MYFYTFSALLMYIILYMCSIHYHAHHKSFIIPKYKFITVLFVNPYFYFCIIVLKEIGTGIVINVNNFESICVFKYRRNHEIKKKKKTMKSLDLFLFLKCKTTYKA